MTTPRQPRAALIVVVLAITAAVLSLASNGVRSVEDFLWEHLSVSPPSFDATLTTDFFVACGLGLILGGTSAQRYGPRRALTASVLGWSASVALLTTADDFPAHLASRVLMGLSQGAALPAAVLLLSRWVPECRRGLANGVVAFGGRFAQAAATVVTPLVIVSFVPLCGLLGVIVAAVAVAVCLAVRGRQAPHAARETSGAFPWRALFASGNQ